MDWIIELIKTAMDEAGEFDLTELEKTLNAEAPKYVVPKHKYNDLSNKLKEANDTIENLGSGDNSELESQLEELATAYEQQAVYYAKRDALIKAGASQDDLDFLMWKLGDEFELNEDGEIEGMDDAVKAIQENEAKYFTAADPAAGKDAGEGEKASEDGKAGAKGDGRWKPFDNKLESGKAISEKAPSTLREAIAEHYSAPAE